MIRVRPVPPLGMLPHVGYGTGGSGRLGDYFLHEVEPGMYRISDTDQDAALARSGPGALYRISSDFPGTGGIVSAGGFFRIFG